MTTISQFPSAIIPKHIRMNVKTDIGHVVKMFAGNKPNDLANLSFGIIAGQPGKSFRLHLYLWLVPLHGNQALRVLHL